MKKLSATIETVAIGDELLSGRISDSNSTFVANELFKNGFVLSRQTVIADDMELIQSTLIEVAKRADVCIVFGGLGPTSDDKTAEAVCKLLRCSLVEDAKSKEQLFAFLKLRNRAITPQALKQVVYPEKSEAIFNPSGLACGFNFVLDDCRFYFLPGVPTEMKAMFGSFVLGSVLKGVAGSELIYKHVWKCLEIPEAELQRLMVPIEEKLPKGAYLGYRTRFPENHLTLYWKSKEKPSQFDSFVLEVRSIISKFVYTESDKELEELVLEKLKQTKQTLVFAESCTGGLACHRVSTVSGASEFLRGGFTPYQVATKDSMLGLKLESDLEAVSQKCTYELARRAKEKTGADIAAAVTGYMGPTGGTAEDPIGTMYFCVISDQVVEKKLVQPWKERSQAQWGAATHLLNLIQKKS